MKKIKNLFTTKDIGIICPKDKKWENMKKLKEGRFCDGCQETLYDVTGYSKGDVMALQRKYGKNICVGVSKTLVTASLALSLSACASKISKDNTTDTKSTTQTEANYDVPLVVGIPVFREEVVEK